MDEISPESALDKLMQGAARFSRGEGLSQAGREQLAAMAVQQAPYAVLVGCSDSRVSPELIFGCDLGELFVVRTAGNTIGPMSLGSIVYGVEVLAAPLIVVLGHARCGAVDAAVRIVNDNARYRGALGHLLLPLVPSVIRAKATNPPDLIAASVRENVHAVVEALHYSEPSISERLSDGRLKIIGAYYDLITGEVDFFE